MRPREHYPIPHHYPRTATDPAELAIECACGEFEFFTQETITGGLDAWGADFEAHVNDTSYD